ncbi:hypothetical protein A1O3_00185 [Capronia epimyces CBS 606.96]|uniref:Major facilitator superfamily (MFS) profile domain-containing protein n=1 Tax=Capronia epimyces CBS 606.96 TaxID=1182542 RepID=W9YPN1_9EURO|nr:uncharacterized protein A1O3_00185 [Capronia epimyces CBS 606.96]EXJ91635.1 hypothetical protein A1O3_00185 [Capronia epimyces CBS 606.96]
MSEHVTMKKSTEMPIQQTFSNEVGEITKADAEDLSRYDIATSYADRFQDGEGYTKQEARRLRWKLDYRLIPILFMNVLLPAYDKNSHALAAIYGMKTDLKMKGSMYSWVSSIFYFGYLLWCFPSSSMLQKLRVAKTIAVVQFLWGIVLIGSAFVKTWGQLMACRFILGALEAPVLPGNMLILSMWYTRPEQTLRYGLMYTGLSSIPKGLIGWGVGGSGSGTLKIWQILFLIAGGITVVWSLVVGIFLPDNQVTAKFLDEKEKAIAVDRVRANQTGVENKKFKKEQMIEAFLDIRVWLMFCFNLCISIPNGGMTNFSTLIIKGLGWSSRQSSLLLMPAGVVQTASSYFCNGGVFLAIKYFPQYQFRGIFTLIGIIIGLIASVFLYTLPLDALHGRLAALFMSYFYLGPYIVGLSLVGANTAGHTKKVTVNALMFISYCVSNIIGPQFFLDDQAPLYPLGMGAILGSYVLSFFFIIFYMLVCWRANKSRDARDAAGGEVNHRDTDFKDLTDKQNIVSAPLDSLSDF